MNWRWFTSSTVRDAADLRKHVLKLVAAQSDLLPAEGIAAIEESAAGLLKLLETDAKKEDLLKGMDALEQVAGKWLKPYPNASIRENVEVVLVAIAVALAVRTFFLQPFKIPTGSMQPTLFGITQEDLRGTPEGQEPPSVKQYIADTFAGVSRYHVVATSDGAIDAIGPVETVFPLVTRLRLKVGDTVYTIWFPPDNLPYRAGLENDNGRVFHKGEDIINCKVIKGDYLFVDRLTYNFRPPTRGEIIVFQTKHVESDAVPKDQFYIKRLVGLSGETLRIGNDQHLVVNGKRLDANTPRFENVYNFPKIPTKYGYFGHVNDMTYRAVFPGRSSIAPYFPDETTTYTVPTNKLVVMGDNTLNSFDSRGWGGFPRNDVIGKACFVYWPLTTRFGWYHR